MNRINGAVTAAPPSAAERKLRDAVQKLEGVFVEQLFKAMRETVPSDGVVSGGAGEAIFTGMMDQHIADIMPQQLGTTLSDALVERFRASLPAAAPGTDSDSPSK